ncbi:MAG: DUF3307 domain-containing protein [Hyphomicrobiaceae bacterium]|nr:DUF3307 domain-containing protein [Hyphomicrobiaceae bacterium]
MGDLSNAILWGFAILAVKHTIADYFLQTAYQFRHKGIYGHPGGILHSVLHIALTPSVFLVLPPASVMMAVAILAGEYVIHYHLDWTKEQLIKRYDLTQTDPWFWHLFGLDQLGHSLTYVAIIAILIS